MEKKIKKLFQTGDSLELHIEGLKQGKVILKSSLKEFLDSGRLIVLADSNTESKLDLKDPNIDIKLSTNKDSAGIIKINATIKEFSESNDNFTLLIELGDEIEQTQRRQHYRLPVLKDVKLGLQGDNLYDGFTQNISAGGVKCIFPIRIRPGAQIKLMMELDSKEFEITGKVLDSIEFNENKNNYVLRIEFIDLNEKLKSKLVSYIFHEQSRQNRIKR